jgi:hypothetical protein
MLLGTKGLRIDGWSEEKDSWLPMVRGVDVPVGTGFGGLHRQVGLGFGRAPGCGLLVDRQDPV